jgi:hypothetical protein
MLMIKTMKSGAVLTAWYEDNRVGRTYFKARDLGVLLGYSSNGGNLSRNIRGTWKSYFKRGDYRELRANPELDKGARTLWVTHVGLLSLLLLSSIEWNQRQGRHRIGLAEAKALIGEIATAFFPRELSGRNGREYHDLISFARR